MHVASKEGYFHLENQADVYGIVAIASDASVYRSLDRGQTWADANTLANPGSRLSSVSSSPRSMIVYNGSIFLYDSGWNAGGARTTNSVLRSDNGGISWSGVGSVTETSISFTDPIYNLQAYQSGNAATANAGATSGIALVGVNGTYASTYTSDDGTGTYGPHIYLPAGSSTVFATIASGPNAWTTGTFSDSGSYKQFGGNGSLPTTRTRQYFQGADNLPQIQTGIPIWHQESNVFVIGGSDGKVYTSNVTTVSGNLGPTVWANSGATAAMSSGSSYIPKVEGYETSTNYAIFNQSYSSNVWVGTTATSWTRRTVPLDTTVDAPIFGFWASSTAVWYQRANSQTANTSAIWVTQDRGATLAQRAMPANKAWIGMVWLG